MKHVKLVIIAFLIMLLTSSIPSSVSELSEGDGGLLEEEYRDVALLEQMGPVGTYEEYLAGREQLSFTIEEVCSPQGRGSLVIIFVESSLLTSLASELLVYNATLRMFAFDTVMYCVSGGDAEDLKNQIVSLWNDGYDVLGSVLIGDLPCEWFHHENDFYGPAEFPCDLFLMDLDGSWIDTDSDGMYDIHSDGSGDTLPEVFVGRIDTSNVPGDEITILKKYFAKVHDFWTGETNQSLLGLTYTDHDWASGTSFRHDMGYAYEDYEAVWWPDVVRDDYVDNRITGPYEFVQLSCHSSPSGHSFHTGGWATCTDIRYAPPIALFYNLFCCSSLRFTEYDCLGYAYIMDTDTPSLSVVGSTKTGSMLDFRYFYEPIGNGAAFGTALKDWFAYEYPYSDSDISWFYGMTVLGDPTLIIHCPKNFPPSSSEITGPDEGVTQKEYSFNVKVYDQEQDSIFCRWRWGDGSVSDWMGPYSSGDTVTGSHIWYEEGDYTIEVKLKDAIGSETGWLSPKTITILQAPILMVKNIESGLLGVSTNIKNDGSVAAENVEWKITLDGGLVLLGRETTGTIDSIIPGDALSIRSSPILGFGETTVIVEVSTEDSQDMRSQNAKILLFYVLVTQGGT